VDDQPYGLRPPSLVDDRIEYARRRESQKAKAAETRRARAATYSPGIASSVGAPEVDIEGIDNMPKWGADAVPVITLLNQKGGVGKSSTCHHLSGTFAQMKRRVLCLDVDPQSSLSQGFFGPVAAREIDPSETIAALFSGNRPYPDQVIKPTGIDGIDLLPGSRVASEFNIPCPYRGSYEVQTCLRDFLAEAKSSYDVVFCDVPPNLHMASWAALVASDYVIVPLAPEDYSSQGIVDVLDSIEMVKATLNPRLELLGFLLTMVSPRRTLHQLYEESLRSLYGDAVFTSRVMASVDYPEAISRRQPIAQFKPRSASAKAIRALAEEIEGRIATRITARTEAA
jgi:chromosome partitioning protein